jgi:polysaccharide transporter, PST family
VSSKKTVAALYLVQAAQHLAPLATLPYLTRILGPDNFGKLGFAQAFSALFVLVTDFGFNVTATRKIAIAKSDPASLSGIYWNTQFVKVTLAIVCATTMLLLARFVPSLRRDFVLISVAATSLLASVLSPVWLYHGLNRLVEFSKITVGVRLSGIALTFLTVRSSHDYIHAAMIQFMLPAVAGTILTARVFRQGVVDLRVGRITRGESLQALRDGFHIFSGSALTVVFTYGNAIVLKFLCGDVQVGLYAASEKLLTPMRQAYAPLTQAYFPNVCEKFAAGERAGAVRLIRKISLAYAALGVLAVAGVWIVGPWILPIVFGQKYAGSMGIASIQVITQVVVSVGMVETTLILVPAGRQEVIKWVYLLAALVHLTYTYFLVRNFQAIGTAVSALLTELVIVTAFGLVINRQRLLVTTPDAPAPSEARGAA